MLIRNINFALPKQKYNNKPSYQHALFANPILTNQLAGDTVTFKGCRELTPVEKYERAMDIVDCFSKDQIQNMDDFDQKHLEGIQYGLKSFEGMSFKDIYFILSNSKGFTIPLYRDCAGRCGACYVNGQPRKQKNLNELERMDFEDYKNLTNDLKAITTRLKFNCREKGLQNSKSLFEYPVNSLFHDSDSKDSWLKDNNGNVHEFPELNKMLFEATGIHGLFDTAGWSLANTKVQERVERMVEYYRNPQNRKELEQINVSVNTYHGLLMKAHEYAEKGDFAGEERMKNQYAKNIANAMYTMTPLLDTGIYQVFLKCVDDYESDEFDSFKQKTLDELITKILDKLRERYTQDLENGGSEFVHCEEDIDELIEEHQGHFTPILNRITPNFENKLFSKLSYEELNYLRFSEYAKYDDVLDVSDNIIIDLNGKVYLSDDDEIFETDLQLNFKNKNQPSKQLYPTPDKRKINTKDKTFE